MKSKQIITAIGLASILFVVGCNKSQPSQPTQPAPQQPPQTTQTPPTTNQSATTQVSGAALYTANCAGCHGTTGAGGSSGPAINTDEFINNSARVQDVIKKGKGSMPSFSAKINDDQNKAIGDFVAGLKK
ncbi:c-type cytochrome [Desulfitobacterium metallireducens]|uniref:Cytochrome C n=1 Tax=Desulfitobacterium metallireducens DSM 15288 TaxID=871968 RepID=W0EFD7_9FIRM|nr:cytochrome c [Desulfitobacterium metallireducens]AHF07914.1 cytochrome C [Desulfitobacterium metallireducens DSM 15288]